MPLGTNVIRVPVKLVDGQWELLYGGPVRMRERAIGELQQALVSGLPEPQREPWSGHCPSAGTGTQAPRD